MNYNQFSSLSCYEEFEIQVALNGISKIDVLKNIGQQLDNYYFFILEDGIFNWFDSEGNHIEDPGILKILKEDHIPRTITKCIIPNSVICINDCVFNNCISLKEIIISNSVTSIGKWAFTWCESLKEITIPDSVIRIDDKVFLDCISLKKITIPNSVTRIGKYAFSRCKSLKEVIFKGKTLNDVKQMENSPFGIEDESIIKCEL